MKKSVKSLLFFVILVINWSIIIDFTPVTAADTLIDETITIVAGTYRSYYIDTNYDNVRLIISIEVLSGNDITVHITDETNYEKWSKGESASGYLTKYKTGSISEEITLGPEGRYYVILDNSYSIITGKSVQVLIEAELSFDLSNFNLLILGFFAVTGVGGILVVIFILNRRSKRIKAYQQVISSPKSPLSVSTFNKSSSGFCSSCGNPIDHSGAFCMKCGQKIPTRD